MGSISDLVNTGTISKTLRDAVPQSFGSLICANWEQRREKLNILREAPGAWSLLRFWF